MFFGDSQVTPRQYLEQNDESIPVSLPLTPINHGLDLNANSTEGRSRVKEKRLLPTTATQLWFIGQTCSGVLSSDKYQEMVFLKRHAVFCI